jgi:hypothetical protein
MNELKTILGKDIPIETRGILYLCHYDSSKPKLTVLQEILCLSAFEALELYANIPNPESQLVTGKTFDELIKNLHRLHEDIVDIEWLRFLEEQL